MIYQGIELHNVAAIRESEGGITWSRLPYGTAETETGAAQAVNSTGVELRFVIHSGTCVLDIEPLDGIALFTVFYGDIQGQWQQCGRRIPMGRQRVEIPPPENLPLLRRMAKEANSAWDPSVVRVILYSGTYRLYGVEGDVTPPDASLCPQKTLLAYGSSITHGSLSLSMPASWVSQTAYKLGTDARNLGLAGQCRMEKAVIDYIAAEGARDAWHICLLELGINVLGWDRETFLARASYAIRHVAQTNPDKPIFVISPFYSKDDFEGAGRAALWRTLLRELASDPSLPNVSYIDGTDLLGEMSLISADLVHPSLFGVNQIASRLTEALSSALSK